MGWNLLLFLRQLQNDGRFELSATHPNAPGNTIFYVRCREPGRFERARIEIGSKLKRPATGATEAVSETWRFPVAVRGSCTKAGVSGKRARKLQNEVFG